jgi:hypothetical protein
LHVDHVTVVDDRRWLLVHDRLQQLMPAVRPKLNAVVSSVFLIDIEVLPFTRKRAATEPQVNRVFFIA